jgi:hypothetical protein
MNTPNETVAEPDLIDRIAAALPPNVRADYYRELRHCRSLPENDEMLRILRAIQISVLLMVEAPGQIVVERERLEKALDGAVKALEGLHRTSEAHHADLDQRLKELPASIAEGISPSEIAGTINESLRQQFVQTTIPVTAEALAASAARIKAAAGEFSKSAATLNDLHDGAVTAARKAVADLESVSANAILRTRDAAEDLCRVFCDNYRWALYALTILAFLFGLGLGLECMHWIDTPKPASQTAPPPQVQPVKPPRR